MREATAAGKRKKKTYGFGSVETVGAGVGPMSGFLGVSLSVVQAFTLGWDTFQFKQGLGRLGHTQLSQAHRSQRQRDGRYVKTGRTHGTMHLYIWEWTAIDDT